MTERSQIADEIWQAFKHWEGERKFALRQIVKHLRKETQQDQALILTRDTSPLSR